jgi:hypothetical protein
MSDVRLSRPYGVFRKTTLLVALAFLLSDGAQAGHAQERLTSDEFAQRFQFGLHRRFAVESTNNPLNPNIYYDGPDSPFVEYLREMRTYGFQGLVLVLRYCDHAPVVRDGNGKWMAPAPFMKKVKEAVQTATDLGYYLTLDSMPFRYSALKDDSLPHERRLTDQYLQRNVDCFEQLFREFRDFPNVAFRSNNEFHGWKYELSLPRDHPNHLSLGEVNRRFLTLLDKLARVARTVNPNAYIFYREGGAQLTDKMVKWPLPIGNDPAPTDTYALQGLNFNYGSGDHFWGYWGRGDSFYTHELLKHLRLNRKWPPERNSLGLLIDWKSQNNAGVLVDRFCTEYHFPGIKNGDLYMSDYQCLAQAEYTLDECNRHRVAVGYADGDVSGGMKNNGIYNTVRKQAHVHNSPHIDMFLNLILEKSHSRRLELRSTEGGTIEHALGMPHKGFHMARIGDEIKLTARPRAGYVFVSWQGSVTAKANPLAVKVQDHGVIWAVFARAGKPAAAPEVYALKRHWDIFEPTETTYADMSQPDRNFAHETLGPVFRPVYKATSRRKAKKKDSTIPKYAFLKFNVDRIPEDRSSIAYATVKFLAVSASSIEVNPPGLKPMIQVHSTKADWKATTLTWENMPELEEELSVNDYAYRLTPRVHLDVTRHLKKHGAGVHSFAVKATVDKEMTEDVRMLVTGGPGTWKTHEKPLLYVAWDEKVPPREWGEPAPAARKAVCVAPANGGRLPGPLSELVWVNGGGATSFNLYFGDSEGMRLIKTQHDAKFDDWDLRWKLAIDPKPHGTYRWRVDAVNGEGKVTQGDVYTFTLPDRITNAAEASFVPASNSRKNRASLALDGDPKTACSTKDAAWLAQLDADYSITALYVTCPPGRKRSVSLSACRVQVLNGEMKPVWESTPGKSAVPTTPFRIPAGTVGRYIRIEKIDKADKTIVKLSEVEAWGTRKR